MALVPPPLPVSPAGMSERLACSLAAAQRFQVPANVLLAVATVENGRPGQWVPNANGSFDLGAMQLNTAYVATLAKYGIKPGHVLAPGCYAYMLAGWRLHGHLTHDTGDLWRRVANYNSRTPVYNLRYQARLAPAADAWKRWLEAYYPQVAAVGGTLLPGPPVPIDILVPSPPMRIEVGRAKRGGIRRMARLTGSNPQGCSFACAPMRVQMSFGSPRAFNPASPQG